MTQYAVGQEVFNDAPFAAIAYCIRDNLFYRGSFQSDAIYYWEDGKWHKSRNDNLQEMIEVENYEFSRGRKAGVVIRELPEIHGIGGRSAFYIWCKIKSGNQKLLRQELGVSAAFLSAMALGKKKIPVELLVPISEFTGIPPAKLRPDIAAIFGVKP